MCQIRWQKQVCTLFRGATNIHLNSPVCVRQCLPLCEWLCGALRTLCSSPDPEIHSARGDLKRPPSVKIRVPGRPRPWKILAQRLPASRRRDVAAEMSRDRSRCRGSAVADAGRLGACIGPPGGAALTWAEVARWTRARWDERTFGRLVCGLLWNRVCGCPSLVTSRKVVLTSSR
jgi:hypothetical protein